MHSLTQHLIDEKHIKEPTPEMLEAFLEKAIELRKELHRMVEGCEVSDHPTRLIEISEKHPNTIKVLESNIPISDYTCLMHALGLARDEKYIEVAQFSLADIGEEVFAGKDFLDWLLSHQHLIGTTKDDISEGDFVLYFDSNEWKHIGIFEANGRITSKWGRGLIYDHALFEVPENYGREVRYYKAIEHDDAYRHFVDFAKEKGIRFDE